MCHLIRRPRIDVVQDEILSSGSGDALLITLVLILQRHNAVDELWSHSDNHTVEGSDEVTGFCDALRATVGSGECSEEFFDLIDVRLVLGLFLCSDSFIAVDEPADRDLIVVNDRLQVLRCFLLIRSRKGETGKSDVEERVDLREISVRAFQRLFHETVKIDVDDDCGELVFATTENRVIRAAVI